MPTPNLHHENRPPFRFSLEKSRQALGLLRTQVQGLREERVLLDVFIQWCLNLCFDGALALYEDNELQGVRAGHIHLSPQRAQAFLPEQLDLSEVFLPFEHDAPHRCARALQTRKPFEAESLGALFQPHVPPAICQHLDSQLDVSFLLVLPLVADPLPSRIEHPTRALVALWLSRTHPDLDSLRLTLDAAVCIIEARLAYLFAIRISQHTRRSHEIALQVASDFFDASPIAQLLIAASDGTILRANKAASEYFKYSPEGLLSLSFLDLKLGEGSDSPALFIYQILVQGPGHADATFRRGDEQLAFGSVFARPLSAEENIFCSNLPPTPAVLISVLDTTERRAAQNTLQRAYDRLNRYVEELETRNTAIVTERKRAQEASRLKSEFLANMSHELRTPMNAIIGFTQRVLKTGNDRLNPREQRNLNIVLRNSQALLRLINNLLDFSRLEAGHMELHTEEFLVVDLIEECAEITEQLTASKAVTIHPDCDPSIHLNSDRDRIRQILLNLLSNAAKFTEQGTISIRVELNPPQYLLRSSLKAPRVAFHVQDTGIGLRPEDQQSIFDAFRQVDGSHSRREGGTGLGLAITAKLADALGGLLTVHSSFGQGSQFTFLCPLQPPTPTQDPSP